MDAIQPQILSLWNLLKDRLFTIPKYQRSYSWSEKHRDDLFKDIESLAGKGRDSSHFMATVVCLRREQLQPDTDVLTRLDIVDGQQRLTTLIILLNAICRALDKKDKKQARNANQLEDLLVKQDGDDLVLLQTNHDSSHFFDTYLRKGKAPSPDTAKTHADRNLLSAISECKDFVDRWVQGPRTLLDLTALIKNRLTFILHEISQEKTVYTVFEVLNSRGIRVAGLDRLKSMLMGFSFDLAKGASTRRLIHDLHRIWGDIYRTVGLRKDLDEELLRFAATLHLPDKPSKPLGEEEAVDSLCAIAKEGGSKTILEVAQWVLAITKACHQVKSNPRQDAVTNTTQARLLAVALHARCDDLHRGQLLDIWERVSFRIYGLHDKDKRTAVGDYCRLAWEVAKDLLPPKEVHERIVEIGSGYPIDGGVENWRNKDDLYPGRTDELRYFMFRYEEHLAQEHGETVDNNDWELIWAKNASLSVEHIRPQSQASDDIKHSLGNLMLLRPGLNSKLRDKRPREKADAYRKTGFFHAREVADMLAQSPRWSKKVCGIRESKLLDWAREEWGDVEWSTNAR